MSTATEQLIPDLSNPATFTDGVPHEALDRIRERPGLYWQEAASLPNGGFWVLTRRADILEVEANPETFTSTRGANYPGMGLDPETNPSRDLIFFMDPPVHSRVRRAAARSFGPRVVANFDGWVRDIVVEALDGAVAKNEFDWVAEVAVLIPARVIARVMGVPNDERHKIVEWANGLFHMGDGDDAADGLEITQQVMAYSAALREEKLRDPKDDMITELAASVEREEISMNEFLFYCMGLMLAGFETTHTLMGQSMRMMVEDPEVSGAFYSTMATDGADPLIEEFLRMISPALDFARTATRNLEFAGEQIKEGDVMHMMFAGANRDPEVFDEPHRFIPGRANGSQHLSFGSGPHRCIGQALARLEMRILFEEIARRDLQFELAGEPKRGWSTFINQLTYLPVRLAG
jgi:cytochrome P450